MGWKLWSLGWDLTWKEVEESMHKIYDSSENYLEAIFVLAKNQEKVHSVDIARHLDVSRASVSNAMKKLEEEGRIIMEDDGAIVMTDSGRAIGAEIDERHRTLREILEKIGVDPETADEDACKIEHAISQDSFDHIKKALAHFEEKKEGQA